LQQKKEGGKKKRVLLQTKNKEARDKKENGNREESTDSMSSSSLERERNLQKHGAKGCWKGKKMTKEHRHLPTCSDPKGEKKAVTKKNWGNGKGGKSLVKRPSALNMGSIPAKGGGNIGVKPESNLLEKSKGQTEKQRDKEESLRPPRYHKVLLNGNGGRRRWRQK